MEFHVEDHPDPLDIGFNITYLLDVLQNLGTEHVRLAFGGAHRARLSTAGAIVLDTDAEAVPGALLAWIETDGAVAKAAA